MLLHRFLKYINFLIALLLVAVMTAAWWLLWRPLPETSGTVKAPVSGRGAAARDARGVPHIRAATIDDALFLQGYVTAQDRLWQMDAARRVASGELAEVAGPDALKSDSESRSLRLRRLAEQQSGNLAPESRAVIAAYARGVNYFLETHRGRLPVEFQLLRYDPRPWSIADTLAIGLQMFRTLTKSWTEEAARASLLEGGDAAKVNELFPLRGAVEAPGSNAWVLAGARTASGKPLLASDPHLEFAFPSTWYQIHLEAPGLNVTGVSLPGIPAVIIGHNERIAWAMTNLLFDVQDLYIEKLDLQSGRYQFRDQVEQAVPERDVIAVRGHKPVPVTIWRTRHGPLLSTEQRLLLALRWTAAEDQPFHFPFLELNRAGEWQEFRAALAKYPGPSQNFVYADVDGNIGYQAAGRFPIRKNYDGGLPVDGASGQFEWEGFIPFEELPSAYNPPSGLIVTANQNPFPADYPYRVNGRFDPEYRARQIRARLESNSGWRAEEMLAIQTDVYSAFSHFLAREAAAACDRRKVKNPSLLPALELLRAWNGQMDRAQPAPFLVTLLFQHLRKAVAEKASPGKGLVYESLMAPAVIERLLSRRPKEWFEDWDQLLVRSLVDAVEEGQRMQGRDLKKWEFGRYNEVSLDHPVLSRIPWAGRYFGIGRVAMSGSSTTVKQTTRRLGPSMRMVADLADWDRSLQNIIGGQSGQPLSGHFKDQWEAHYAGRSFPMQYRKVEAKATLTFEPK